MLVLVLTLAGEKLNAMKVGGVLFALLSGACFANA